MKKILFVIFVSLSTVVYSSEYIIDNENLFTLDEIVSLESKSKDLFVVTGHKMYVTTDYITPIDKNDIIILISKERRTVRVYGDNLNKYIDDDVKITYITDIFPFLYKNEYYPATVQLMESLQLDILEKYMNKKIFTVIILTSLVYGIIFGLFIYALILFIKIILYRKKIKNKIKKIQANCKKYHTTLQKNNIDSTINITNWAYNSNSEFLELLLKMEFELKVKYDRYRNIIKLKTKISAYKDDIKQYLTDNYPYCVNKLKKELDFVLSETKLKNLEDYTEKTLNELIRIDFSIDHKINSFLNKISKINSIIENYDNLKRIISKFNEKRLEYLTQTTILCTSKIGTRYNSLQIINYDKLIKELTKYSTDSFNYLENDDYNNAIKAYSLCNATIMIINNTFNSANTLYNEFNIANNNILQLKNNIKEFIKKIDKYLKDFNVPYQRISELSIIKTTLAELSPKDDIIGYFNEMKMIDLNLKKLLNDIKTDIDDNNHKK